VIFSKVCATQTRRFLRLFLQAHAFANVSNWWAIFGPSRDILTSTPVPEISANQVDVLARVGY